MGRPTRTHKFTANSDTKRCVKLAPGCMTYGGKVSCKAVGQRKTQECTVQVANISLGLKDMTVQHKCWNSARES